MAGLFLLLMASQLSTSHSAALNAARTDARNLARVLDARLAADFEAARSAVNVMATEFDPAALRPADGASGHGARISQQLRGRIRNIRSATALRYFDARGDMLYSSVDNVEVNVADRSYFRQARADRSGAVIFSEVLRSRVNQRPTMMVAKAMRGPDGAFLGIATAAIDIDALREEFGQIELGEAGTVVLRRLENGAAVVIYPGPAGVDNRPHPDLPLRRAILGQGPSGVIEFLSPVDGIERLYGYRVLRDLPFFVAVGISERAYLAGWRSNLTRTALASSLFLLLLASVFILLGRAEALRNRIDRANRRHEQQLEAIFGALSEGMLFHDRDGSVIDANPAACRLLGMQRHELLGKPQARLQITGEDQRPLGAACYPSALALRGEPVRDRVMGVQVAGRLRWLSVSSAPVFSHGEAAQPEYAVTTFSDITERRQAETDLRIAATAFQSQDGIMVTDRDGVILRVNDAFTAITGYGPAELLGRTPRLLHSGKQDPAFYDAMWHSIRTTGKWQGEVQDRHRNGELCPIWLTISAVRDAGGAVTHYVGIHTDITERKKAETAMLALNRELSDSRMQLRALAAQNEIRLERERKHIAREVHDELGQILTALRMELSFTGLRFGVLDPAVADKVGDMKQLVDLAISSVRNVVVNLRPPALDMGVVPAIEWLCTDFARKSRIPCTLDADEQHIVLDEARAVVVFRIVQESLTNVARYARAGAVVIRLRVRAGGLQLQVCDDGSGFDPRAAAAARTFGLLGMRERALALGGRVDIDSEPGQGTRILLWVPGNELNSEEMH